MFVDIAHGAQIDVSPCDVTQLFAQRPSLRDTWCTHLEIPITKLSPGGNFETLADRVVAWLHYYKY